MLFFPFFADDLPGAADLEHFHMYFSFFTFCALVHILYAKELGPLYL